MNSRLAKFAIGQVVKHRIFPFRGVVFDVDPVFANTEEWWDSIPEDIRPTKDQPFYHLLAENDDNSYVAYVSEQNLLPDEQRRAGGPSADRGDLRVFDHGPTSFAPGSRTRRETFRHRPRFLAQNPNSICQIRGVTSLS
jgi:heat shock protein HspQ